MVNNLFINLNFCRIAAWNKWNSSKKEIRSCETCGHDSYLSPEATRKHPK
jgi:hypothetical protein